MGDLKTASTFQMFCAIQSVNFWFSPLSYLDPQHCHCHLGVSFLIYIYILQLMVFRYFKTSIIYLMKVWIYVLSYTEENPHTHTIEENSCEKLFVCGRVLRDLESWVLVPHPDIQILIAQELKYSPPHMFLSLWFGTGEKQTTSSIRFLSHQRFPSQLGMILVSYLYPVDSYSSAYSCLCWSFDF